MNELYTTVILPVTTVIMTVVIETLISVTKLMIIMSYGNQKQLTAKQNGWSRRQKTLTAGFGLYTSREHASSLLRY